jgi:hypothetical protein
MREFVKDLLAQRSASASSPIDNLTAGMGKTEQWRKDWHFYEKWWYNRAKRH